MQHLIKHLLTNNREEILSKSLLNCHVKGVHSIMLLEAPEKTIRLYVADTNHELATNNEDDVMLGEKLTVALHPHHCNLTLYCVKGRFLNWIVEESEDYRGVDLTQYHYTSALRGGNMKFKKVKDNCNLATISDDYVHAGFSVKMDAHTIHSVACDKGKRAAWLVFEGKEDKNYMPYSWSNVDLENQSSEGLYQKPTWKDIYSLLEMAGFNKNSMLSK